MVNSPPMQGNPGFAALRNGFAVVQKVGFTHHNKNTIEIQLAPIKTLNAAARPMIAALRKLLEQAPQVRKSVESGQGVWASKGQYGENKS